MDGLREGARVRAATRGARKEEARTAAAKCAIKMVSDAKIGAEKMIRTCEQKVQSSIAQAKGIESIGSAKAKGILAESEAEKLGAQSMKAARLHEIELKRLETLEKLASNGNMMLTGKRAAQVMDYLAPIGEDKASAFTSRMREDEV